METQIKESLITLLAGIKSSDIEVIVAETARLDEFLSAGGASLHPQLAHFLKQRSYAKAVTFLNAVENAR
jgi:hypothetical protein